MSSQKEQPHHKGFDPSVIGRAPDETEEARRDLAPDQEQDLWTLIARLQTELSVATAENDELKAKADLDTEKAKLIKPYANKVFRYLCFYTAGVFIVLLLSGFKLLGFTLDGSVLSFIVGSTAVAAIGLVHTVVKGLFGPLKG